MEIQANSITLSYTQAGPGAADKTPLLLLHGNGEDRHIFDALLPRLASVHPLYALDSRNHGESERTEDYAYQTMAEDTAAFIEALGLERVSLVGFSDGAIIALLLAMHRPELVDRLALLGINLKPEDFTEEAMSWLRASYAASGDPLLRLMLEQPQIELTAAARVTAPALIVAAENDIFRPESFEALAAAMQARLLVMAGHEHDSYVAGTDILAEELLFFLG